MNAALKAVHGLALCLLLGGPLFWTCIWRVLDTPEARHATRQGYGTACAWAPGLGQSASCSQALRMYYVSRIK